MGAPPSVVARIAPLCPSEGTTSVVTGQHWKMRKHTSARGYTMGAPPLISPLCLSEGTTSVATGLHRKALKTHLSRHAYYAVSVKCPGRTQTHEAQRLERPPHIVCCPGYPSPNRVDHKGSTKERGRVQSVTCSQYRGRGRCTLPLPDPRASFACTLVRGYLPPSRKASERDAGNNAFTAGAWNAETGARRSAPGRRQ